MPKKLVYQLQDFPKNKDRSKHFHFLETQIDFYLDCKILIQAKRPHTVLFPIHTYAVDLIFNDKTIYLGNGLFDQ